MVSCASAKSCAAGGTYLDRNVSIHAFVVSGKIDANGKWVWGKAIRVPGTPKEAASLLDLMPQRSHLLGRRSIEWQLPRRPGVRREQERSGTWGKAKELPGLYGLGSGESSELTSIVRQRRQLRRHR